MAKKFPTEVRSQAFQRLLRGNSVTAVSADLGVSAATLHRWKRRALIDLDLLAGTKSIEVDELAQARQTIAELEAELEITRSASAMFNGEEPVSPKGGARLPRR